MNDPEVRARLARALQARRRAFLLSDLRDTPLKRGMGRMRSPRRVAARPVGPELSRDEPGTGDMHVDQAISAAARGTLRAARGGGRLLAGSEYGSRPRCGPLLSAATGVGAP